MQVELAGSVKSSGHDKFAKLHLYRSRREYLTRHNTRKTPRCFYFPLGDARRTLNAFVALLQGFDVQEVEQWEKDFISCTHDRLPLRTLNRMKTGYLIQDVRRIELKNLIAKREGGSFITGDVANRAGLAQRRRCKPGHRRRGVCWQCRPLHRVASHL
mgnify:CR=1 FL=1